MNRNSTFHKSVLVRTIFSLVLIITFSQGHAAMYKYITKDGQTLLTGQKLKGSGHKLLKVFKIKRSGAYKSSDSNKTVKKTISSKKYSSTRTGKKRFKRSKKSSAVRKLRFRAPAARRSTGPAPRPPRPCSA